MKKLIHVGGLTILGDLLAVLELFMYVPCTDTMYKSISQVYISNLFILLFYIHIQHSFFQN